MKKKNDLWHSFLMFFAYPSFILYVYAILAKLEGLSPKIFGETMFVVGLLWFSFALLDSILRDKGIW